MPMIVSFRHKGLRELFEEQRTSRLPQERLNKIRLILSAIDSANYPDDLNQPGFRLHKLRKPPLEGWYSIDVTGNYRIVFRFDDGRATGLDFLDTH